MLLTIVTSHATDYPLSHCINDMPSGLLPSVLDKLVGFFIAGMPALFIDRHFTVIQSLVAGKAPQRHLAAKIMVAVSINHSAVY